MNRYEPILNFTKDQEAFLNKYTRNIAPSARRQVGLFYLYLLNKRRKWFKAKSLLRELPKGLKLDADSEEDLRDIIREHGGNEHLELFICGTIEAVYEGAAEWAEKYRQAKHECGREILETENAELKRSCEDLTGRNTMLEETLRDAMNQAEARYAAWQMERTILQDQLKDELTEIDKLKDRNEQLLKVCNDYYDTHLIPLNKKYDELCQIYGDLKQIAYDTDNKLKEATEQLEKQHSIMAALRAVFQLSKDAYI